MSNENITRHIKTHTERSVDDQSAVSILKTFLRSNGKINTNFTENDKWPNTDGEFEFVPHPDISRKPVQKFSVQIKGSRVYQEKDEIIKYNLQSLAFPAVIYNEVTLDPGILFVVLNPNSRGQERVFWKYISDGFLASIDFTKDSKMIDFTVNDEIKNTEDSIEYFCNKLESISNQHSFVKKLERRDYSEYEVKKIIAVCNNEIMESIDRIEAVDSNRDIVSQRILRYLEELCKATLLLNAIKLGLKNPNMRLSWERAILNIDTKYLCVFLKGLRYVDNRIPDEGQSERLMLKYYDFLWQIRKFLFVCFNINILNNLEKFLDDNDEIDNVYYGEVANAINSIKNSVAPFCTSRFYVQKKTPFFIGKERYYEITLQLAGKYATKYNRLTVYSKNDIPSDYSVQIAYINADMKLWNINSKIKLVTNWKVSIEPTCLNKLGKAVNVSIKLNAKYGEYIVLMDFLTKTGISILDLIDLGDDVFNSIMNEVYNTTNTSYFKDVLCKLQRDFSKSSTAVGKYSIRYLLLDLREETLENVLTTPYYPKKLDASLGLSAKCMPFEKNPFISNLAGGRTNSDNMVSLIRNVTGNRLYNVSIPYIAIKKRVNKTGEIYFNLESISTQEKIDEFNSSLDHWERINGYRIVQEDGLVHIESYEKSTIKILQILLEYANKGNKGQKEFNKDYLQKSGIKFDDEQKENAIKNIFINSHLALIYGAAGTGKTTLINHISNLMSGKKKLFLTKTHTTLQNLKRSIENPGTTSDFISIDSFTKKVFLPDYDVIFVDECSVIDNRSILAFLRKIAPDTFIVLGGDIYQIESIDFGNWFYYAKEIVKSHGANIELLNTWRTEEENIKNLWHEVRIKSSLITEHLVIDGPFSEEISEKIFSRNEKDEVVLCLNYDGKFGLNNINNYFQNSNPNRELFYWREWSYKIGDPILFNDTKRFNLLHNNLKGKIINIEMSENEITFIVDVNIILTESDCARDELDFIDIVDNHTRIKFSIYNLDGSEVEYGEDYIRMMSVVPFQLAYAVSIHKAQGLEYDSVKIIIPSSNTEKITHDIFYTAITRAKKKLKIYWSGETMQDIVSNFSSNEMKVKSLSIIKLKLEDNAIR